MKSTDQILNTEDIIDSRDVITRIEYLESERQTLADALEELESDETTNHVSEIAEAKSALAEWDDGEEADELKALRALADEASGYAPNWSYGEQLIRDSYFTEYAQELADDIGAIPKDAQWPCQFIDWDRAADALKQDYTSVDFDGTTYWIR